MSVEFPTLAEVANEFRSSGQLADLGQHVESAWREACTIGTAEQLQALPANAVVIDDMSDLLQKHNPRGSWRLIGFLGYHLPVLPALLIWHPDWAQS